MIIKKSALFLIVLATGSVGLLVYSAGMATAVPVSPGIPVECTPAKSCSQINEPRTFSTWDMIPEIMLRPAV